MSGERVLVVDDEPQFLRALTTSLRAAGYEVSTATTGAEALTSIGLGPPDGVILDLVLPDTTGTEVCRELRTWSEVPVIVVSANAFGTPAVSAIPSVAMPEPAFTSSESTCP